VPAPDLPHALSSLRPPAGGVLAYVGPGAGLEWVGYALTLLLYTLTALSAVLLWPVYALLRRLRRGKHPPASPAGDAPPAGGVAEEARAADRADR
jgi:hypothetical protein